MPFPIKEPVVSAFWSDIDLRQGGAVMYTVLDDHSSDISDVKEYLEHKNIKLNVTVVLIARWDNICAYTGHDNEETCLVSHHPGTCDNIYYRETHFRPLWQQMAIAPMLYLHISVID